jgi:hypothetical protein
MAAFAFLLFWLILVLTVFGGWVVNLFTLVTSFGDMALVEVIIRIAGVPLVLLGSVMGLFF